MNPLDEPIKVMFAGDWHGETLWAQRAIEQAAQEGCSHLLHLGDFGLWPGASGAKYLRKVSKTAVDSDIQVLVTPGNHEWWAKLERTTPNAAGLLPLAPNIHFFPRPFRWEWSGLTWMSAGGAPSIDVKSRTIGVDWWPGEAMSDAEAVAALTGGPADVLLTHDAPSTANVPGLTDNWDPAALASCNQHRGLLHLVGSAVQPALWWHGHHHVHYRERISFRGAPCVITGLGMQWDPNNLQVVAMDDIKAAVAELRGE